MMYVLSTILALFPTFALAATAPNNFNDLVRRLLSIIDVIVPAIFALTMVVVFWGVIKGWIINVGDERSRTEGKNVAVVGVIVFVVMISLWGIVKMLQTTLFSI